MIESAIVGRPVLSLLRERYADTQARSVHFSYLNTVGGGLVHTAADAEDHARDLRPASPATRAARGGGRRSCARSSGRTGWTRTATPRMVAALERAAAGPVPRPRRVRGGCLLRLALRPFAARAQAGGRGPSPPRRARRRR